MITAHSNTVYNCASCGSPVYCHDVTGWVHFGAAGHTPEPVVVRLPVPVRVTA